MAKTNPAETGVNPAQNIGEPSKNPKPKYLYGPYTINEGFKTSDMSPRVTGTRIYLSNLAYSTSVQDVMGLFSKFESVKHCNIHYDRFGMSLGSGEVVFSSFSDAWAAMKEFDKYEVYLDEKKVKLEMGMNYSDLQEERTEMQQGEMTDMATTDTLVQFG